MEPVFRDLRGVQDVVVGYAGGTAPNPTYEQVCTGRTGHAEVVQVTFDPQVINYLDLLRVFFAVHDPTTRNRQGADVGTQYRSVILFHSPQQQTAAEQVMRDLEGAGLWPRPVVTELVPLDRFYPAEEYHRRYFETHPYKSYCRVVIAPKLAKFRASELARLMAA
jgi:peptide-methionine (S)-S-oxide reductase